MILNFIAKHRILSLIIFLLILALPILYFVYTSIDRAGKIPVNIIAVPSDMTLTLDGKTISPGERYLPPGTYTVKGSKDGFTDFTTQVIITSGDKKKSTSILLNPATGAAIDWAKAHKDEYLEAEGQAGSEARDEGEAFRDKNPIVNLLPYKNLLYTIGYRSDPDDPSGNSIILEIDADEPYRKSAIYQIYQWGYDPTDFKINFKNFKSQF